MLIFFSIVIPSYNHGHFIGQTLQSLIDQTYTNWEAIIVDNHSTDNTDEIVESFNDPRIKIHKIHNNGVIAVSRNFGIKVAQGQWIAFLDSDDYWTANKLALSYNVIQKFNPDLLFHDMIICNNNSSKTGVIKGRILGINPVRDLMVNGNPIVNSSVISKKKILEDVGYINESQEMIGAEDFNTWLKIANEKMTFFYINENLGFYREHNSGVSKKDMSFVMGVAMKPFISQLNSNDLKKTISLVKYTALKYRFDNSIGRPKLGDLIFCINHGSVVLKFKSLYVFVFSLFK